MRSPIAHAQNCAIAVQFPIPVSWQMTMDKPSKTLCVIVLEGTAYPIRYVLRHVGGLILQQLKHHCRKYTPSLTTYMDCRNVQMKQLFSLQETSSRELRCC
jgi:hypothetical protein